MEFLELKQEVLEAAKRCARRGAGHAQQRVVLNEVAEKFGGSSFSLPDIHLQQKILTCWHDLFREGVLSWGYDLDNPDAPFFHMPERAHLQGR